MSVAPILHSRACEPPTEKDSAFYHQIWRIVDGAVRRCFNDHSDYLKQMTKAQQKRERVIRNSINKRVVGALVGFAANDAAKVQLGTLKRDASWPTRRGLSVRPASERPLTDARSRGQAGKSPAPTPYEVFEQ